MKKQAATTKSDRQMKFAEAGVLFVLILGLTLFIGVKIASNDTDVEVAVVEQEATSEVVTGESMIESPIEMSPDIFAQDEEAITALEEVVVDGDLESNPPRVVTYALSEQAYFTGNFEEAAEMFSLYTQEHPDNAWGHYMLGLSSWKAGDPDAAEEAFVAALDIKPDHLKSLINYGRVLLEMDRSEDAQVQLEAALTIDPNSVDANRVLGRAYHNLGLLNEAAASYRTALAIKVDDVWSLNNLGLIYIEQEQFTAALPPLAKAAQLKQDAACIQNNLGVALERNGHIQDSRLAFERALAADDQYAKAEESLQRVSDLTVSDDVAALDLDLIAASFTTEPIITEPIITELESTMEPAEIAVVSSEIQEK